MASKDLRLPPALSPTVKSHNTDGLPGFPANDIFGSPGETVLAPVSGTLVYSHMIPWNLQKAVGGETVYLQGDNGKTYFLTHMTGNVPTGRIQAGQPIGQIAAVPQNAWASHVHMGIYDGIYNPPGMSSSPTTPTTTTTTSDGGSQDGLAQGVQGATGYQLTPGQATFINRLSKDTGLPTPFLEAWVHEEQNNQNAQRYEGQGYNNWLNIGNTDQMVAAGRRNNDPVYNNPLTAADATAAWMQGKSKAGYDYASQGIQDWYRAATGPGATAQSIISGLQGSGWASGGEGLLNTIYSHYAGGSGLVTGATGSSGANGGTNDTAPSGGGNTKNTQPLGPPAPTGSTLYGPPAPGGLWATATEDASLRRAADPSGDHERDPEAAAGCRRWRDTPRDLAPPVHVAPAVGVGSALSSAGLPTTDLSPFTITPPPILPTTAATPTPVTPNPFQIFGLRP